jgi:hypothetical protein
MTKLQYDSVEPLKPGRYVLSHPSGETLMAYRRKGEAGTAVWMCSDAIGDWHESWDTFRIRFGGWTLRSVREERRFHERLGWDDEDIRAAQDAARKLGAPVITNTYIIHAILKAVAKSRKERSL